MHTYTTYGIYTTALIHYCKVYVKVFLYIKEHFNIAKCKNLLYSNDVYILNIN